MPLPGEGSVYRRGDGPWVASISVGESSSAGTLRISRGRQPPCMGCGGSTSPARLPGWLASHSVTFSMTGCWRMPQMFGRAKWRATGNWPPTSHRSGRLRLSKVESCHLIAFYAAKRREGLPTGRVRKLHAVLRRAFGDAVRWGLVSRNIAAAVEAPRSETASSTPWNLLEIRRFIAAAGDDDRPDARLLLLLLWSGLRLGEAMALRWTDVDRREATITVSRSLTHVDGKPVVGLPETGAGMRTLALPPEAVTVPRWQVTMQAERRLAAGWQKVMRDGVIRVHEWTNAAPPVHLSNTGSIGRVCSEVSGPETAWPWAARPILARADFEPVGDVVA